MRFNCGPTQAEKEVAKEQRLSQWHRWFAWRPIRISAQECVWLEFIERKGRSTRGYAGVWWEWDYRMPQGLEDVC